MTDSELFSRKAVLLQVVLIAFTSSTVCGQNPSQQPDFESQIAPLLIKRCVECHRGKNPSGSLNLTNQVGLNEGGESGPVVNHKTPGQSYLLERIVQDEMPPKKQGHSQKLPDAEIKMIRDWLAGGAIWPEGRELDFFERTNEVRAGRDWWSLQPVVRPVVPRLKTQPPNPIDAFVRKRLESHGIQHAPKADRRTLIRRLYYDVIGLPPSRTDIEAFVSDTDPDAWPKLVDRLLAKPQFGERWARYWLDLARYADTSGYERDQEKPYAWKYRDWIIDALNDDMPYDQFIIHQIAGDEIPDRTQRSVIATGFLRLGAWNDEPNIPQDYQYDRIEDLVHTTSTAFLGLTVKCARCHAHKFDAITQEDYYRMASTFWPGPLLGDRKDVGGPTSERLGVTDVLGWTDNGPTPKPLHVLKNGEREHPLDVVVPASLSFIPSLERRFDPPPKGAKTTLRRLQLAHWIAAPENPLTSRVLVNRLWQHHFGKAIVRTPNNFGFLADKPTHPDLLDWLAAEFDAGGRRMKAIHRLILTSETWQQSSLHPDAETLERTDSGNRLWYRSERRRLDAEALRDSMLAVSGELDLKIGGPSFKATISAEALEGLSRKTTAWNASPPEQQTRRSLYMYLKRGLLPPMMTTFDLSDPTLSCGQRDVTIVPTQALALLNSKFVHQRSERLAVNIANAETDPTRRAGLAWSKVLRRDPTESELKLSLEHMAKQMKIFHATSLDDAPAIDQQRIAESLVLHFSAANAVTSDDGDNRVRLVPDASGKQHHATQPNSDSQPIFVAQGFGDRPTLHFDGKDDFLNIAGDLLPGQFCSIICVVNDENASGHRAVISNWNGNAGNATTSLFLGLTADDQVRFSDAFSNAGRVLDRSQPFVFASVNGSDRASVRQNGKLLGSAASLSARRLDTPWVVGQQGNINGEFWNGGIAEICVYDRALSKAERRFVEGELAKEYGLRLAPLEDAPSRLPPETLALASLCHALMNSNEFIFVD